MQNNDDGKTFTVLLFFEWCPIMASSRSQTKSTSIHFKAFFQLPRY